MLIKINGNMLFESSIGSFVSSDMESQEKKCNQNESLKALSFLEAI